MIQLLDLPVETLEQIFSRLAPSEKSRCYDPRLSDIFGNFVTAPFRSDCANVRLTCRALAKLDAPSAALFYDFNVFVTARSLKNLIQLSQHVLLRRHVKRLVFCRPPFNSGLSERRVYADKVMEEFYGGLISCSCPYLVDDAIDPALKAYRLALSEQTRLLESHDYMETCATCLPRFPRLNCIFITGPEPPIMFNMDDQESYHPKVMRTLEVDIMAVSWFERTYPSVLLSSWNCQGITADEAAENHMSRVLKAMAMAGVAPAQLVADEGCGPSFSGSWGTFQDWQDLDLTRVTCLDLKLRDETEVPGAKSDWTEILSPVLQKTTSLVSLHLRIEYDTQHGPRPFSMLWQLELPQLRDLCLSGFRIPIPTFCTFFETHKLQSLGLISVKKEHNDNPGRWYDVIHQIRRERCLQHVLLAIEREGKEVFVNNWKEHAQWVGNPSLCDFFSGKTKDLTSDWHNW